MTPTGEPLTAVLTNLGVGGVIIWILVNWLREHKLDNNENARKIQEAINENGRTLHAEMAEFRLALRETAEKHEHVMRGLSRSVVLDLAERSKPGSFIHEEAKRLVEQDRERERNRNQYGQDKMRGA